MSEDNKVLSGVPSPGAGDDAAEEGDAELVQLVSYLDGELDDSSVEMMERRLVAEAPLRQRAEQLDKTWQLLDSLEEVTASGEFRQKTLASMATTSDPEATEDSAGVIHPLIPWRKAISCFVISAAVSSLALKAAQWKMWKSRSAADVQLLDNLNLLENLNRYDVIRDVSFLHKLAAESSGTQVPEASEQKAPE